MPLARNQPKRRILANKRLLIEPIGVSPRETAYMIGGSLSTVYRLLGGGQLLAVKRGTAALVLIDSIRAYQASLPRATFGASTVA